MIKNKIYVGIDPDVENSGIAILDKNSKIKLQFKILDYFELFDYLRQLNNKHDILVVIEKGELNKTLFKAEAVYRNTKGNNTKKLKFGLKVASRTGRNFEATNIIIKFCEYVNINYKIYVPKSKKFDAKFVKQAFGYAGQTNQDKRDALRCIAGYF